MRNTAVTYVGQVEQDPRGTLWAVLYYRDQVITREEVRSLRKARRRVRDLVLSAADIYPAGPKRVPESPPCPPLALQAQSRGTHQAAISHLV